MGPFPWTQYLKMPTLDALPRVVRIVPIIRKRTATPVVRVFNPIRT